MEFTVTNIDFSTLSSQYPKSYSALDFEQIMPLYDYHSWDGGKNPRIDKITNTLINLKKNRSPAISFFSKVVRSQLLSLIGSQPKIFCVVPSHSKDDVSEGMMKVMSNIREDFGFANVSNLLNRTLTVPKAATGGDRSVQHHLDSIEILNRDYVQGKAVFLFDDISTTGNSMNACKQLLLEAGAQSVVMISFGQTWFELG
ncbi:phosphoribosyltransferase [Thalassotalea hakodatensis]|uniref:phosphoribosyltransferase n=1 Tax=Thalassotalea hakodatensis TaxID=3030492 RepID=UPI00257222E9|nr:phosphoribosyltransferase [Thalassotalea hakodatensis]